MTVNKLKWKITRYLIIDLHVFLLIVHIMFTCHMAMIQK